MRILILNWFRCAMLCRGTGLTIPLVVTPAVEREAGADLPLNFHPAAT